MDGMDAVIADFSAASITLIAHAHLPYPAKLLDLLQQLSIPGDNEIDQLGAAEYGVAELSVAVIAKCLSKAGLTARDIIAIGSHGQTIRHRPRNAQQEVMSPFTLQVGDPNVIAVQTGIPVVADFRRKDMALGGQGAPLVPAFHQATFDTPKRTEAILNLGGIANITLLPEHSSQQSVIGFDTGPANTLMDVWIKQQKGLAYDHDGEWSRSGNVIQDLLSRMLQDPYFQLPAPKSTGKEYFSTQWLNHYLGNSSLRAEDIQATLCALTVTSISQALKPYPPINELIVCGGGALNRYLLEQLSQHLPQTTVVTSHSRGIDPMHVEALAFAWLAKQFYARLPGNIPAVTGASRPAILGALYPAE